MAVRQANARWEGSLTEGSGAMALGSGALDVPYSFGTRFEEEPGTNPEELIGAAHAGCFSMALSGALGKEGHEPESVETRARVHLDKADDGFRISRIELESSARVAGIGDEDFQRIAEAAKQGCPVSQALAAIEITLDARLES